MLPTDLNKKLESKINSKLVQKAKRGKLEDGFKKNKVINEVFDKPTVMTVYEMIKSKIIAYLNGSVKAGKESVVFWGVNEKQEDIALKIYLVSTSNFKKRMPYLAGDPRFTRIKKGTKNLVYLWAKKEFRNLKQAHAAQIPVVEPISVSNNVLAMRFVGKNGIPAKTLVETNIDQKDYEAAISLITQLYQKAHLVHGDFSEYNIFKTEKGLVLFDFGSAVDIKHPNSKEFLKRDINNITNFFVKRGLTVENPEDILNRVLK